MVSDARPSVAWCANLALVPRLSALCDGCIKLRCFSDGGKANGNSGSWSACAGFWAACRWRPLWLQAEVANGTVPSLEARGLLEATRAALLEGAYRAKPLERSELEGLINTW